jgi:hypothetical protein
MKARVDYLKVKCDGRSQEHRQPARALDRERDPLRDRELPLQHPAARLFRRRAVLRQLVASRARPFTSPRIIPTRPTRLSTWALKWASHRGDVEWLWVFQQKGDAPITRGVRYRAHRGHGDGRHRQRREARFRQFAETFGTDPWLDVKPIYDIHDEDIPQSATEI